MPGLEDVQLHLADEVLPLWRAVQVETADLDTPLPYWAFAWSGGLAIGRYLRDHPEAVRDRTHVRPGDRLRALRDRRDAGRGRDGRRRRHRSVCRCRDPAERTGQSPARHRRPSRRAGGRTARGRRDPGGRLLVRGPARRSSRSAGSNAASRNGTDVLIGDPGRRYLPSDGLVELASYEVRTTTELEDMDRKHAGVYRLR